MRFARSLIASLLAASLALPATPALAKPSPAEKPSPHAALPVAHTTGRLIVRLKGAPTASAVERMRARAGLSAGEVSALNDQQLLVRVPKGRALGALKRDLEDSGLVAYAEPDYIRQLAAYTPAAYAAPNDPDYNSADSRTVLGVTYPYARSWWLRSLGAPGTWPVAFTGPSVAGRFPLRAPAEQFKIGVIDSGAYLTHGDIGPNIVAGWDMCESYSSATGAIVTDGDVTPAPPIPATDPGKINEASHGTCVSGIIAAAANNSTGTVGIGYDAQVRMYKVMGRWIEGDPANPTQYPPNIPIIPDSAVIAGIRRAADEGCRIISISIGGYELSQAEKDAVEYAWNRGAVIVAAAGNEATVANFYPAGLPNVIGVGSYELDANGNRVRSAFSNYGPQLDVMAPGRGIWGLTKPDYDPLGTGQPGYRWWDGTSMAAPMVAGSISLLWRAVPTLTNSELSQVVEGSTVRMAPVAYDTYTGYGAFSLPNAYTRLVTAYPLLRLTPVFVPSVSPSPDVPVTWLAPSGRGLTYDVALDGVTVATRLDTTRFVLHGVPDGAHTVTLTPRSTYNWDDGSQAATVSLSVAAGSAPVHAQVTRLAGADRYAANANAVEAGWSGARTVVLVGGEVWPDALSAAPLARQLEGPVLVTRTRTLSANAAAEIRRLGASQVVIVGGPNSVSEGVRAQVQGMGVGVRRIWGSDRYTTAEAVARELASLQGGQLAEKTAIVASGETFTDALPASAVAATRRWPILLSRRTGAPTSTRATIVALGGSRTVVVGRYNTLSTTVNKQFPGVERISAGTQLNVPVALANWAVTRYPASFDGRSLALVSSTAWADGLSAGSLSSLDGSLVILTPKNLAAEPAAYLRAVKPRVDRLRVIGGPVSVSDSALNSARSLLR